MIEAHCEILRMGRSGLRNCYRIGKKRYGGDSDYTIYDLARDLLADGEAWDQDIRIIGADAVISLTGSLSVMAGCSLTENASGFSYKGWAKGRQGYRPYDRRQNADSR